MAMAKAKLRGMEDERWTLEDKLLQYRGLIKLCARDREKALEEAARERREARRRIRQLRQDIEYFRKFLGESMFGDKQRLRSVLSHDRTIQLAYQGRVRVRQSLWPDRVIEHLSHLNTTLQKALDRLRYKRTCRMKVFEKLRYEQASLEDRREEKAPRSEQRKHQVVVNRIQRAIVHQNAAASVNHTYRQMILILKEDSIYFDAMLTILRKDERSQCKCVLRGAELAQMAEEELRMLREDYVFHERLVKVNMRERARLVRSLRQTAEDLFASCNLLMQSDSASDALEEEASEAENALPYQLNELEDVMKEIQAATLVPTFDDIYPRLQEQLLHKQRLVVTIARNTALRDELLRMREHGELLLTTLEHAEAHAFLKHKERAEAMRRQIGEERSRAKRERQLMDEQGQVVVAIKVALDSLSNVLQRVRDEPLKERAGGEDVAVDNAPSGTSAMSDEAIELPPERDALGALAFVTHKLYILLAAESELSALRKHEARICFQADVARRLAEADGRADGSKIEDTLLVTEFQSEDPTVPTREEMKARAAAAVEEHERLQAAMQMSPRPGRR